MAVYKLFPLKDNFISSIHPTSNYGRDEILEVSSDISRILIQFDQNEINELINSIGDNFTTNLRLFTAYSSYIPQDYNIEIYPLSQSWIMGTGRQGDLPNPQNGSSWNYSNPIYTSSYWNGGSFITSSMVTQSFNYQTPKDINCDITDIILNWNSGSYENNGLLIKHNDLNESQSILLKFFSLDTHTIYPPHLEFKWNDCSYSSSLPLVNDNFKLSLINNKKELQENSVYKFRIKCRDLFPIRNFQTSSLYLNTKILPSGSYWGLKDVKTEEIIIDYDDIGTKIGADDNGNYFNLYCNGLQPERYYQFVFKIKHNNNVIIIDDKDNYFKLIR